MIPADEKNLYAIYKRARRSPSHEAVVDLYEAVREIIHERNLRIAELESNVRIADFELRLRTAARRGPA
jgi:hypothetical protein